MRAESRSVARDLFLIIETHISPDVKSVTKTGTTNGSGRRAVTGSMEFWG
jgi:hypothetical protein